MTPREQAQAVLSEHDLSGVGEDQVAILRAGSVAVISREEAAHVVESLLEQGALVADPEDPEGTVVYTERALADTETLRTAAEVGRCAVVFVDGFDAEAFEL